ncbi:MAG: T9SS C-terminal target domain-containing protein [Cryomorphaceae bacterium]|nr:MAG: T9SS C-terminal target domain-containing protein [Cryomorphaceae bacterium]
MQKVILLFVSVFISAQLAAQVRVNAPGKFLVEQLRNLEPGQAIPAHWVQDYDLVKINGTYHIGVLAMVDEDLMDDAHLESVGAINRTQAGNIWTFRVPVLNVPLFLQNPGLLQVEIAEPVAPFLDENIPSARVDSVHLGLGGLQQAYKGQGVVVAVIDWGFDYTHPVFYDENLENYRLVRAWDQNKLDGTPPAGYDFGAEYIEQDLLIAQHDTDYVFGPGTHGTHVAGIAGGAGGGPDAVFSLGPNPEAKIMGAAPESDLIFISLRRDAPSLIDGFNYIKNYAESVGKPFVVNMSFGSHLGPHDGNDLKNVGIDNLQGPGRIFVGSAGNNGNGNFHLDRDFASNPDTLLTVVNIHGSSDWGQTLSMWGSENSSFSASIRLVNSADETVFQTPFYQTALEPQINDFFLVGNDTLYIRVQSTAAFTTNDKPNIRLEVRNTSNLKIVLIAASNDSHLHIWSNARMQNRYTNWGSNLTSNYPGAVAGNTEYAPGEPAGCGKHVITVGAYRAERVFANGTVLYGALAGFSSRGPTVDGRVKPDITSGGVDVWSAVNSFTTSGQLSVEVDGNTYEFTRFDGTSMSGPLVAGIVALMLEANPELTTLEAREILRSTARLDQHTGDIGPEGTLDWGWGKAHALAAVLASEIVSSIEEKEVVAELFTAWPNPTTDVINIEIAQHAHGQIWVNIFDMSGKLEHSTSINQGGAFFTVSVGHLPAGMYLIRVDTEKQTSFRRVVVSR